MNIHIFNTCLLIGWLLIFAGVAVQWGVPAGLVVAGVLLLLLTLLLARWAGVRPSNPRDRHVPDSPA